MQWLDDISYIFLIGIAVVMALMPFQPEPHLVEKYHMFLAGDLRKPMDIIDVIWHLLPTVLLLIKLLREFAKPS